MGKKLLYAVYDNDKKIGEYTSAEAAAELGVCQRNIVTAISHNQRIKWRYSFVPIGPADYEKDRFAREWDTARKRVLAAIGR
ncbi:MAG: hypothetical protein ACK5H4_12035 [Lacrimispora sphenoides]